MSTHEIFNEIFGVKQRAKPQRWLKIVTPQNKCQDAAILSPMPKGPYIIVSQHIDIPLLWSKAAMLYDLTPEFELEWGKVIYANVDGLCMKVGYWYDTSD